MAARRRSRSSVVLMGACAAVLASARLAAAATITWNGGGADDNWTTAANWVGGVAPVAGDVVVFSGSIRSNPFNDNPAGTLFGGINILSNDANFQLGGNGITLGGDILDNTITAPAGTQLISMPLLLNGTRTISVTGGSNATVGGNLIISGAISDGGANFGLNLINSNISRILTSGGATVGAYSLGAVTLTAANTYTGATNVQLGRLILDFNAVGAPTDNIISSSSPLTLGATGVSTTTPGVGQLIMTGNSVGAASQTFAGTTIGNGLNSISVTSNGQTTNLNLGALTRTNRGTLAFTLPASGAISASSGLENGIIGGWATVGSDWATISGGNVVAYSGYVTISGNVAVTNTTNAPAGSNVKWSGYDNTTNTPRAIGVAATTTDLESIIMADNTATTVPINGILRLGAHGGISRAAGNNSFTFSGGTITAGGAANTAGELVINNPQTGTNNSGNITISSVIANNGTGPLTLIKTGTGSLTINTATNTFTGDTYINQGRINLNVASGFGPANSRVFIQPGGHLFVNTGTPTSYNYFIAGLGSHENVGDFGAIRLNNNQNLNGTITLIGDARIASFAANATINARITGNNGLELNGLQNTTNGLTITNVLNDWTGFTQLNRGIVTLGNSEVIPNGSDVTMTIGDTGGAAGTSTLNLNGKNETIGALSSAPFLSGSIFIQNTVANSTSTLTVGASNANGDFGGTIRDNAGSGGKVALVKTGSGTQTLSSDNPFTGGVTINNGVLRVGNIGALNSTGVNTLTFGASAPAGTALRLGGNGITLAGLVTNATPGSPAVENASDTDAILTLNSAANTTYAGLIRNGTGSGKLGLAKNGAGTLTLAGTATHTGDTNINAGTLRVTGSFNSTGNIIVNNGGTLSVSGSISSTNNVSVPFGGILSATGNAGSVNMQSGSSIRPGSVADGSVGTLSMSSLSASGGDFRLDLTSPGNNDQIAVSGLADFTGPTTLSLAAAPAGTYTVLTAGTLSGTAPTLNTAGATTRATYTVDFDTTANRIRLIVEGTPKSLTWTGTGTPGDLWDVNNTVNWTDGAIAEKYFDLDSVTFGNGPANRNITISGTVKPSSVVVNNSAGNDYSFNFGTIGDGGFVGGTSLTKLGAGTLSLNSFNSYAGPTNIQDGTVILGSFQALPNGTALTLGDAAANTSGLLDLGGNSISVSSLATAGSGSGNIIGSSSTGSPVTITVTGGTTVFNGVIKDTLGAGTQQTSLTLSGGSLTLAGDSTYTGPTSISAGATLQIGTGGTSGSIGSTAVTDDGTLAFNRSDAVTFAAGISGAGSLQHLGSGTLRLTGPISYTGPTTISSGTLIIDRSDPVTLPGVISGGGNLENAGTGTTTLSGINTYTGTTTISKGVVVVTNGVAGGASSLGAVPTAPGGDVFIASGARLNLGSGGANNGMNFGQKVFHIAGDGGGLGVITNRDVSLADGSVGGTTQQNSLQRVILDADSSIGSSGRTFDDADGGNSLGRIDMRVGSFGTAGILNLNGHNLTKIGSSFFALVNIDVQGTGNIIVAGGDLNLEAATHVLNDGSSRIIVKDGAMLQFWNTTAAGATNITRPVEMGDGTPTSGTFLAIGGGVSSIGSSFLLKGDLTQKPTYGNFNNNDGILLGNITEDATPRKLIKTNINTLTLSGANSFTGGLELNISRSNGAANVLNAPGTGIVQIGSAGGLHPSNVVSFGPLAGTGGNPFTAILRLNGFNQTIAGLRTTASGGSSFVENNSATPVTLTINNTGTHSFDGVIRDGTTGALTLAKSGAGVQALGGANTYTGGTLISGGTLAVNNSTGSGTGTGAVTVSAGGTLGGGGIISGNVSVQANGHVAPGNSVGTLTMNGLTLDGAMLDMQGDGTGFDHINLSGIDTLNLASASTVSLSDLGGVNVGDYVLIDYIGTPLSSISNLSLSSNTLGSHSVSLFHDTADTSIKLRVEEGAFPQWNVDADGSWGTAANWVGGVPNGVTAVANFLGKITTPHTVSLDGDRTVGSMAFDNAQSYTIATGSGGALHLGDASSPAVVSVLNGSHVISAAVAVDGTTDVNIAQDKALTLSGGVSIAAGKTLRKNDRGTLTISGTQTHGAGATLDVLEGTLNLNSNAGGGGEKPALVIGQENANATVVLGADQDLSELTVSFAPDGLATLDLKSGPGATDFHQVRVYAADLAAAKSSLWDAIRAANSPSAVNPLDGIIDSGLHSASGIGMAVAGDHVTIRSTRIGDLNLDGSTTIADFITLASHFNQSGTWQEGDVNYDGNVTIADFIALASNFNQSYSGASNPINPADVQLLASFASSNGVDPGIIGSAVPEPASFGLLIGAGALLMGRRRRK